MGGKGHKLTRRITAMKEMLFKNFICIAITIGYLFLYPGSNLSAASLKNDKEKILLLCLDGATWNIMRPLIEKGQLANFSKLIKNGVSGELFSDPAYSPPSWTSIATGKRQEKHGVYNFYDAKKRKARYIWDILSDFDIKVGIMNWKMALPEEVNGFMFLQKPDKSNIMQFYPEALPKSEAGGAIDIIKPHPWKSTREEAYKFFNPLEENVKNISMVLIKKYQPSFIAIGFLLTDTFQHCYWSALEPEYFDISLKEVKNKGNLITGYYKKIDKFLDYFIKNNYTIIFVSDHGHCRNDSRSGPRIIKYHQRNSVMQHINFLINCLLEKAGLLTFVPKPVWGGQIDFSKSQAFFYNNVISGIKGIKINRKIVQEDKIAELKKRIYFLLNEAHFESGEKVFVNVKENVSKKDMPDIFFNLNPIFKKGNLSFKIDDKDPSLLIFFYLLDKKKEKLTKIILEDKEYKLGDFIGRSRDGVHEPEGVIIMAGKHIRKNRLVEGAKTFDIAPTILYLLGLPAAKDMDGRVLIEAFEPAFLDKQQIKYIDTYGQVERKESTLQGEDAVTDKEAIKERIRSLGYAQ